MAYGVVRTDNMFGTDVASGLVSVEYMGEDGRTATDIENGNVLKITKLMEGEREIFVGEAVKANDKLSDVVLVASPEVMYGEHMKSLEHFINVAGKPCRGYRFHSGSTFAATKECFAGKEEPAVGNIVELAAGTKLNIADSLTAESTAVGKIIAIEDAGKFKFYVVKVD